MAIANYQGEKTKYVFFLNAPRVHTSFYTRLCNTKPITCISIINIHLVYTFLLCKYFVAIGRDISCIIYTWLLVILNVFYFYPK